MISQKGTKVPSAIANLFEPLGWLSRVKLWKEKSPNIDWNTKLPDSLREKFKNWYNNIPANNTIKISGWLKYVPDAKYKLYGFPDASKNAYGACTYLKLKQRGKSTVHLLQAKSKVAPLKPILTIPKLELNAAHLLIKFTIKVLRALKLDVVKTYLYYESTDVLSRLKEHPSKWNRFVKHRCSEIHTFL